MSIWSSASGSLSIRKDKHVSLKRIVESVRSDELVFRCDTQLTGQFWVYTVHIGWPIDSETAINLMSELVWALKQNGFKGELTIEIRTFL